jgi:hypothetical protein
MLRTGLWTAAPASTNYRGGAGGGGVKKSAPADNSALLPNFLSENRQTRPGDPPTPRTPIYGRAGCEDRPQAALRRSQAAPVPPGLYNN